jgi:glycyl-tRNA synthetase
MEIEYFLKPADWEKYFEYFRAEMVRWMETIGIDMTRIHELEVADGDRAHYSSRTIDFEFDFPFGRKELYGLAYRTDFDLKNHDLTYQDEETNEKNATPNENSEYIFCSERLARLLAMMISRSKSSTASTSR